MIVDAAFVASAYDTDAGAYVVTLALSPESRDALRALSLASVRVKFRAPSIAGAFYRSDADLKRESTVATHAVVKLDALVIHVGHRPDKMTTGARLWIDEPPPPPPPPEPLTAEQRRSVQSFAATVAALEQFALVEPDNFRALMRRASNLKET